MSGVVVEVLSGLGVGGAERAFLNRVASLSLEKLFVVNTQPHLNFLKLPNQVSAADCPRSSIFFISRLRRCLKDLKISCMVVRSPFELILLTIFKSFNRGKWPIVFEAHSTKLSPSSSIAAIMRLPFKMAVSRASLVIAASKSVARGEQCRGAKNVSIHYFGGKKCLIERRNYDLTFIFVGRLVELKEPHKLLDAVSALANKLREACGKVLIIGNGPLEESLRKKVTSLGLVDIVKILGYQSNLSPYYSNSDYLISTSRFEGLPLTFFEAKMSGLKIITTPSSGDFDILGVEDHILKDFSVEAIIGGISVAIDHGLVEKEERREIQEKYSWMDSSLCVEKYNKLLDILLSEFSD